MEKEQVTEEKIKPAFRLSDEELANPKFRKGYPGRLYRVYPKSWDKEATTPHGNYKENLSSYYKAGRFLGLRGELMSAINATLPPPKPRKMEEIDG